MTIQISTEMFPYSVIFVLLTDWNTKGQDLRIQTCLTDRIMTAMFLQIVSEVYRLYIVRYVIR